MINEDPYGKGWIVEMDITGGVEELLTVLEYKKLVEEE